MSTWSRSGTTRPAFVLSRIGRQLLPVMGIMPLVSHAMPAKSRIVGAMSVKFTKSSMTRPGFRMPRGQRMASGTWFESW